MTGILSKYNGEEVTGHLGECLHSRGIRLSALWKLHYGGARMEAECSQEAIRTVLKKGSLERCWQVLEGKRTDLGNRNQ